MTTDNSPTSGVQLLEVAPDHAGQRIDNFLLARLKGVPKTLIYRILRKGEVRVNKGRIKPEYKLQAGDIVRVPPLRLAERDEPAPLAQSLLERLEAAIVYEDKALIVLNKPAGIAVHGGSGLSFGVIEGLRALRPEARFLELVHRLDRETSGILLVAKKRSALKALQDQFRNRSTGKTYLALACGEWPANKKVIDLPLHKYLVPTGDGEGERRVRTVAKGDPDGMPAVSLVRLAQRLQDFEEDNRIQLERFL